MNDGISVFKLLLRDPTKIMVSEIYLKLDLKFLIIATRGKLIYRKQKSIAIQLTGSVCHCTVFS